MGAAGAVKMPRKPGACSKVEGQRRGLGTCYSWHTPAGDAFVHLKQHALQLPHTQNFVTHLSGRLIQEEVVRLPKCTVGRQERQAEAER